MPSLVRLVVGTQTKDVCRRSNSFHTLSWQVTHVIVDEAHERDMNSDFLLTVLRDLLAKWVKHAGLNRGLEGSLG